jgi:hypothetical protein
MHAGVTAVKEELLADGDATSLGPFSKLVFIPLQRQCIYLSASDSRQEARRISKLMFACMPDPHTTVHICTLLDCM